MQSIGSVIRRELLAYVVLSSALGACCGVGVIPCPPLLVGFVKRERMIFALLQTGQYLLFGPFIDRAVVRADQREAGDGERSEEAGDETICRFSRRVVLVDGAADLAQAERHRFCARMPPSCFTLRDINHCLR